MHNKPVDVDQWNALVDSLARCRLVGGLNVTAATDGRTGGQVISCDLATAQAGRFNHPWKIAPRWSESLRSYTFKVYPGFVNGLPARATVPDPADGESRVKVELTEFPEIIIPDSRWTEAAQYGVLQYFKDLGVADAPKDGEDSAPTRLLYRCDVVLSIPKMVINGELNVEDGEVKYSYTTGNQTLDVRENRANIVTYAKWSPPEITSAAMAAFGELVEEPSTDELLLGTIYLLGPSPEEVAVDASQWDSFSVHVAHSVFWNLGYVADTQLLSYQGTTITPRTNLTSALDALGEIGRLTSLMSTPFGDKPPSNPGHYWTV
ncbi:MAG: hypothetical protein WCO60_18345 [Verrucomicrobiota bacterium]